MPRYYPILTVNGKEQVYQFDPSSAPTPQAIAEWAKAATGGTYTGRLLAPDDPRIQTSIPDPSLSPESAPPEAVERLPYTGPSLPGSGTPLTQEEIANQASNESPSFLSMIPSIAAGSALPAAFGPLVNAIPDPRVRAAIIAAGPLVHTLARGGLAALGGAGGAIPGHYIQKSQREGTLSKHPYYGIPQSQTGPSLGNRAGSEALLSALPEIASSVPLGILQGIRRSRVTPERAPEIAALTRAQSNAGLSPPSARGILKSGTLGRAETSRTVRELGAQHLDAIISEAYQQLDQLGGKVARARDPRLLDPAVFASQSGKIIRQEITPGRAETRSMLTQLRTAATAAGGTAPTLSDARAAVSRRLIAELEASSGFPLSTLINGNELLARAISTNRLGELTNLGRSLPELGELIRRAHLAELISSSSSAVRSGELVFQPSLFLRNIDRTPDTVLRAVYGKQGYKNLRQFTDVLATAPEASEFAAARLRPTGSFAANKVGWPIVATALGSLAALGGAAASSFAPQNIGPMGASLFYTVSGAMFVTPAIMNRMLRSEDGVRWLTGATKTANKWTGSPDQLQRTLLRTGLQAGIHHILTNDPITTASAAEMDDQFATPIPEFSNRPTPQFSNPPSPQLSNPPVPQLSNPPTNLPSPSVEQSRVPVEVTPEEKISSFIRSKNPLSSTQRR